MSSNLRDLATRWFFLNEWGFRSAPKRTDAAAFGKALVACASADGRLAPEEQEWILGYLASAGADEAELDAIRGYQGGEDPRGSLEGSTIGEGGRRNIIFDAIRACWADGELHEQERAAVIRLAGKLGVSPETVHALESAYAAEREARAVRIKLIYPDGPPFQR